MICKECKNKPIARGIKFVKCFRCDENTTVNSFHKNICNDCSDKYQVCQYCGNKIEQHQI